ncbi:MAG: hypothetical protein MJ051_03685 [Akkermansia sp.]|nr:hypothetical protein [Akkermansia sp.]
MKLHISLLAATLLCGAAFAGPAAPTADFADNGASFKRLSGSLNAGYETNYNGRGLVMSHSVAEGDSAMFAALKYNYDFGRQGGWSWDGALSYRNVPSGHTLYGNPSFGPTFRGQQQMFASMIQPDPAWQGMPGNAIASNYISQFVGTELEGLTKNEVEAQMDHIASGSIKQANIEPEIAIVNSLKYTREKWNFALGHDFIHGGILGVMAKHYRDQGASCVNEVFVRPEWTPAKWVSVGCTTRFSFEGIVGWWFEPDVTFKAPIIGTPDDVKLAGVVQFGLSATADYFRSSYFACDNGTQAFWIKLATPWFVTKNFIITPSVSFNWLGKGAINANKTSEFRYYTENSHSIPFRNFGVVGGCAATYTF